MGRESRDVARTVEKRTKRGEKDSSIGWSDGDKSDGVDGSMEALHCEEGPDDLWKRG